MLKKEPKKTNEENPLKKNRNLPTVEEAKAEDEVTKELQIRNLTKAAHIPHLTAHSPTRPHLPASLIEPTHLPARETVTKEHNVSIANLE